MSRVRNDGYGKTTCTDASKQPLDYDVVTTRASVNDIARNYQYSLLAGITISKISMWSIYTEGIQKPSHPKYVLSNPARSSCVVR